MLRTFTQMCLFSLLLVPSIGEAETNRKSVVPELGMEIVCLAAANEGSWELSERRGIYELHFREDATDSLRKNNEWLNTAPTSLRISVPRSPCFYEIKQLYELNIAINQKVLEVPRTIAIDGRKFPYIVGQNELSRIVDDLMGRCAIGTLEDHNAPFDGLIIGSSLDDHCYKRVYRILDQFSLDITFKTAKEGALNTLVFVFGVPYFKGIEVKSW